MICIPVFSSSLVQNAPGNGSDMNNFGVIRLLLASLVVFGHSPELIDGNRSREPLTEMFGVLSLGEAAVNGFFLVSGYLLIASILSSSLRDYFAKRITRIYPGFIVASLVCVLIVGPLAGGEHIHSGDVLRGILRILLLQPPQSNTAFLGLPHPDLDGSMWTISCEFFCYIMLAALAYLGVLKKPRYLLYGTVILLALVAVIHFVFGGQTQSLLGFMSAFLAGVCFRNYLTETRRNGLVALACGLLLILCLGNKWLAEPALITLGGYILFWFAERHIAPVVSGIGRHYDLSYGIYLYAWPIQNLLIWKLHLNDPAFVSCFALIGSALIAILSWKIVERPSFKFRRKLAAA
jgi:peptidoglycan/LPS O-acetylase OafA/YrhL